MFDHYPDVMITLGASLSHDLMFVDENKQRVVFKNYFNAMVCHKTINIKPLVCLPTFHSISEDGEALASLYLQGRIKLVICTVLDFASQVITLLMTATCEVIVFVITRAKQCHCEKGLSK